MTSMRFIATAGLIGISLGAAGCAGTCPIITRHDAEPEWVCPGRDFSPKNHFRIQNFNEDGKASSSGTTLWGIWETSKGKHGQPGSVALTSKVAGQVSSKGGVIETQPAGVHAVGGSWTAGYLFTLVAANTDCPRDGEAYLRQKQAEIEKLFGVELDDAEVMTAHARVEVLPGPAVRRICVPHAVDVQGGFTWTKDEVRAGSGMVIDGVENPNAFEIEVIHQLPAGSVSRVLGAKAKNPGFDGRTPNGKWSIKASSSAEYDKYVKHGLKYVGNPSICISVGIRCQ